MKRNIEEFLSTVVQFVRRDTTIMVISGNIRKVPCAPLSSINRKAKEGCVGIR